jgi:hypothetical protein
MRWKALQFVRLSCRMKWIFCQLVEHLEDVILLLSLAAMLLIIVHEDAQAKGQTVGASSRDTNHVYLLGRYWIASAK